MKPVEIPNKTRTFTAAPNATEPMDDLHVRDEATDNGVPVMVSEWVLSDAERDAIYWEDANIRLSVAGNVHPPVKLSVEGVE